MTTAILVWELFGAAVGAGLASGREIASFFSQYGPWSWAAIGSAVITLLALVTSRRTPFRKVCRTDRLWHVVSSILLMTTGGAMLAGAGEIARLVLPVRFAYGAGMIATLAAAWLLAHRTTAGLAWISRVMLGVLIGMIALGVLADPMCAAVLPRKQPAEAVLRGVAYGGFNAALLTPVMAASSLSAREKARAGVCACLMLGVLLLLGNVVLLHHPALQGDAMPFVRLMNGYGRAGYMLGACALYLAVLSTLTACLRGLGRSRIWMTGVLLTAMAGFTGVVDALYPLLGGICAAILLTGKIQEFLHKHFSFPR